MLDLSCRVPWRLTRFRPVRNILEAGAKIGREARADRVAGDRLEFGGYVRPENAHRDPVALRFWVLCLRLV